MFSETICKFSIPRGILTHLLIRFMFLETLVEVLSIGFEPLTFIVLTV